MSVENVTDDATTYRVVINHEEQYSIWPVHRDIPLGWNDAGKSGSKAECLSYIKDVWTDMRPLSLRKKMAEIEKFPPQPSAQPHIVEDKDDLVIRLSAPAQPVELVLRANRNARTALERIKAGYVNIKFPNTRGGTELGVTLDNGATQTDQVNPENGKGLAHLEGGLTLNGHNVRCIADIDLETFKGFGHLKPVESSSVA